MNFDHLQYDQSIAALNLWIHLKPNEVSYVKSNIHKILNQEDFKTFQFEETRLIVIFPLVCSYSNLN